jgi:hypothetical protein
MSGVGAVLAIFATLHIINMSKYTTTPARFLSGNSFLPTFMLYSSFRSGENVLYASMVLLSLLITLIFLCNQLAVEDKEMKTLEAFEAISDTPFSKNILCVWDCSLTTKLEIDDVKSDLTNRLTQQLEEKKSLGKVKLRSNYEAVTILLRRICGCFLHICVSLVAFSLIIYFTINSKSIANSIPSIPGIGPIGSLISPFVLQAINTAMPIVLNLITRIEMWDSALTVMNVVLLRIYISSTLNSLILAFVLADNSSTHRNMVPSAEGREAAVMTKERAYTKPLVCCMWAMFGAIASEVGYTPYRNVDYEPDQRNCFKASLGDR